MLKHKRKRQRKCQRKRKRKRNRKRKCKRKRNRKRKRNIFYTPIHIFNLHVLVNLTVVWFLFYYG